MPLTPTHIIAVLPLAGVFASVPFSALAIGSIVPDIALFFPIVEYSQTHSLLGLLTTCLPVGLLCYFLFETILRRPLIALGPTFIQSRIKSSFSLEEALAIRHLVLASLCVTLGSASHVLWDSFTHAGRWGTQWANVLNSVVTIADFNVPAYKVLQHGSSVVCLPILAAAAVNRLMRTPPDNSRIVRLPIYTRHILLSQLVIIPSVIWAMQFRSETPLIQMISSVGTRSVASLTLITLLYSALFTVFHRHNGSPNARHRPVVNDK